MGKPSNHISVGLAAGGGSNSAARDDDCERVSVNHIELPVKVRNHGGRVQRVLQQCTPVLTEIGTVLALQGALNSIWRYGRGWRHTSPSLGRCTYNPRTLATQIIMREGEESHHALLKQLAQFL